MVLSEDLISQFTKVLKNDNNTKQDKTVSGIIRTDGNNLFVELDGSTIKTPVVTTMDIKDGDRVNVLIKNHVAIVTGSTSAVAARNESLEGKVNAEELNAVTGRVESLESDNVTIKETLTASGATIGDLVTNNTEIVKSLSAAEADIEKLQANKLGMDRLPAIPESSDLNNYIEPGCYAVQNNEIAATCSNIPIDRAGRLEVWSATGEGNRSEKWSYLRQRYIPYNSSNAVWERDITRSSDNVWKYYDWWKSSLTPTASEFVYHEPKILWGDGLTSGMYMTEGHTITLKEAVSAQRHGIVLVFCAYNGTDDTNYSWQSFFVPKQLVALSTSGHTFNLSREKFTYIGTKYLYIKDTSIVGHADNNLTGSNNGITYANNKFVLRYVIGV